MKTTSVSRPLIAIMVLVLAGAVITILFTTSSSGPEPTSDERKQMDILSGQLFVFAGVTNTVKRKRSIAAFDGQHEMIPYLRLLAPYFERYSWPKDRPVRIRDQGDRIDVVWPFPPEIENDPFLLRPDCIYYSPIDKREMKVIFFALGG